MKLKNFILLITTLLTGCASMTSIDEKGRVVIHHFGYVKVIKPPVYPKNKEINVSGVSVLGFSVGEGLTIGYKNSEFVKVPIDCRVLVIVDDSSQFSHLLTEISNIQGDEICATVSPK